MHGALHPQCTVPTYCTYGTVVRTGTWYGDSNSVPTYRTASSWAYRDTVHTVPTNSHLCSQAPLLCSVSTCLPTARFLLGIIPAELNVWRRLKRFNRLFLVGDQRLEQLTRINPVL